MRLRSAAIVVVLAVGAFASSGAGVATSAGVQRASKPSKAARCAALARIVRDAKNASRKAATQAASTNRRTAKQRAASRRAAKRRVARRRAAERRMRKLGCPTKAAKRPTPSAPAAPTAPGTSAPAPAGPDPPAPPPYPDVYDIVLPPAPPPPPPPVVSTLGVGAYDTGGFELRLTRTSVAAGSLTVFFRNYDVSLHNLWISGPGGDVVEQLSDAVGEGGGATHTLPVTPGTWRLFCSLPDHEAMTRDLTVTP